MELCPRTFALYRPGEKIEGVGHVWKYSWPERDRKEGVLKCALCNAVWIEEFANGENK
jgi:hypothetical protein